MKNDVMIERFFEDRHHNCQTASDIRTVFFYSITVDFNVGTVKNIETIANLNKEAFN